VAAVIPAKNEEESIESCLRSLLVQTHPISKIVVVNDASTDKTEEIVKKLMKDYPQIFCVNKFDDKTFRAGAVNYGLRFLSDDFDLVLIADADAILQKNSIQEAVKIFERDEKIGAVCSTVELRGKGFLHRLQKLEYGGFNAERVCTWQNVMIVHGLCGVFRLRALKEVGGLTPRVLLEDYDLTLKLKKAGYKTIFSPKVQASTQSVKTVYRLFKQRVRWYRGGIDIILRHGINRFTAYDFFNHLLFILLFLVVFLIVVLGIFNFGKWRFQPLWHPISVSLLVLGFIDGIFRLKWVKGRDWIDVLIRISILPEIIYYTAQSMVRIYCYFLTIIGAERSW
jgi:cellulose synthase/poly-beta-1,6-N-acetylglucosamine synthase-like glycosyltransferase